MITLKTHRGHISQPPDKITSFHVSPLGHHSLSAPMREHWNAISSPIQSRSQAVLIDPDSSSHGLTDTVEHTVEQEVPLDGLSLGSITVV